MRKSKTTVKIIWNTFALLALFFSSCAPSINVRVQHPPNLNTAGIKRIAIMPFEARFVNRDTAQYATTAVTSKIQQMNYFTLVSASEIERLRKDNLSIEGYVDAIFSGQIIRVDIKNENVPGSYKTKDGQTVNYIDYMTNVEVEFNYSFVLSRDGRIIGPVTKSGKNSASSRENYPSSQELIRSVIDSQLSNLVRDVAPYTTMETRTFVTESSKDKVLKAEMKDALALVKAGSYRDALETYLDIYNRYKNIAAAQNAAILHELINDTNTAAGFMQQVLDDTGNQKARDSLSRLNRIKRDQEILASNYSDNRNRTERVAALASEEIQKVLPKDARVWIYNNAAKNAITEAVSDNITSDLIKKNISVVDRQSLKLIEAEQKLQMSGYVSDDDFISIGNAAGANTIVVIDIIGTVPARRLQVRVLNVEKGVTIMQSDTNTKWQI